MAGVFGLQPDVGGLLVLFFPALIAHGDVIGVAFGEEPSETCSRVEVETLVRPVFPDFHHVELQREVGGMVTCPHLGICESAVLFKKKPVPCRRTVYVRNNFSGEIPREVPCVSAVSVNDAIPGRSVQWLQLVEPQFSGIFGKVIVQAEPDPWAYVEGHARPDFRGDACPGRSIHIRNADTMRRRGAGFSIQTPGASAISPAAALLSPDINEGHKEDRCYCQC